MLLYKKNVVKKEIDEERKKNEFHRKDCEALVRFSLSLQVWMV